MVVGSQNYENTGGMMKREPVAFAVVKGEDGRVGKVKLREGMRACVKDCPAG